MADLTHSLIQIKRSQYSTHPGSLFPGELAFSSDEKGSNLGVLYIGGAGLATDGSGKAATVHAIGGTKFTTLLEGTPGQVAAGKAIIAGANGEVDQLAVGTLNGVVTDPDAGTKTLVVGDEKTTTIIHDPYVAGAGENGANVPLTQYVSTLVESGVTLAAGAGIAAIEKDESGAFVIGLAEIATIEADKVYGSETKIPAFKLNAYGQVVAVEEKVISTKLAVDGHEVDLVSGKIVAADGIKSTQSATGEVTISADDTVIRTTGGQTIAGTLAVEGQATFGVAPKVGEEETVITDATVGEALIYQTEIPSTVVVGGIKKGTTYADGITVLNLIDTMLHPYVAPTSYSITTNTAAGTYECGTTKTVSTATVKWTNGSQQIKTVEVYNGSTLVGSKALSSLATSTTVTLDSSVDVTKDSASKQFTAKIIDSTSTYTTGATTFTFVYPYYMGVVESGVAVTGDVVAGLTKKVQGKATTSHSYSTGGVAGQIVFAYPATHSDIKSAMDPNNFENIDSFAKQTLSVTGLDGTAQNYKVYVATMNVDAFTLKFTHA